MDDDSLEPACIYGDEGYEFPSMLPNLALEPLLYGTTALARSFYERVQSISTSIDNEFCDESQPVTFTLDSGSDVHVIQLHEAVKYFTSICASNLRVLGVSGATTRADLQGHLVISVQDDDGYLFNPLIDKVVDH
jgi:hypothetical protein